MEPSDAHAREALFPSLLIERMAGCAETDWEKRSPCSLGRGKEYGQWKHIGGSGWQGLYRLSRHSTDHVALGGAAIPKNARNDSSE